jgi:PhnB protein
MTAKNDHFVQVHLDFNGRCEEAIEFYKQAIGAETVMLVRVKDLPDKPSCAPDSLEKIMHARIRIGETVVLVTDGRCTGTAATFTGFSLSVTVRSDSEVDRLCTGLAQGGKVEMPPAKTFFSSRFAFLTDKFGVPWMILVKPVGT